MSAIPLAALLVMMIALIITRGADCVSQWGPVLLLGAASLAIIVAAACGTFRFKELKIGMTRSAVQLLPAVPVLLCIAMVASTWMLSGIVPTLICYGLAIIDPQWFLLTCCAVCGLVSVMLGSSWTTIATVGLAFLGIGSVLGYSEGWIAGAIISGAYFGDKVSPLSDTTVIASSACGVDIFTHIRSMMATTVPTIVITLAIFGVAGAMMHTGGEAHTAEMAGLIRQTFVVSPWLLVVPAVTIALCAFRVGSLLVLVISAALGLAAMFVAQPQVVAEIGGGLDAAFKAIFSGTALVTGSPELDALAATSGIAGMVSTVCLVLSGMVFGGVLLGTGMIQSITRTLRSRLRRRHSVVGATVATGLTLNACTSDQYLSIIIGANLYRTLYRKASLEAPVLSRSLEDSISVTSVLIPWNSCGMTQSTVLGVSTLTYLPYCFFNYLSPIMSVAVAALGAKIVPGLRRLIPYRSLSNHGKTRIYR